MWHRNHLPNYYWHFSVALGGFVTSIRHSNQLINLFPAVYRRSGGYVQGRETKRSRGWWLLIIINYLSSADTDGEGSGSKPDSSLPWELNSKRSNWVKYALSSWGCSLQFQNFFGISFILKSYWEYSLYWWQTAFQYHTRSLPLPQFCQSINVNS